MVKIVALCFMCWEGPHNSFKDNFVFFMMVEKVLCSSFQVSVMEMKMKMKLRVESYFLGVSNLLVEGGLTLI